ncbi:MAG: DHHW family protein [Acutalibacteraceae bacterium]
MLNLLPKNKIKPESDDTYDEIYRLFGDEGPHSKRERVIENPKPEMNPRPETKFTKILYKVSAAVFAAVLVILGFVSVVDKDKTVSESENRALAKRPKLTASSVFKGEFSVDFENYYSDNFPARDSFIKLNQPLNKFLTQFKFGDDGDVIVEVNKSGGDFAGEGVDLDNTTAPTSGGIKENTAAVTPDEDATVKGTIILSGDRAMEIYTYSETSAKRYASIINSLAKSVPTAKVYSIIAPTSVEFYGTKKYRSGEHSQHDAIKNVYSMLDSSVTAVDVYSPIMEKADEYIYFRTDHHWTARGAYYAYTAFCKAANTTAPDISSYTTHNIDGFLGSLYRQTQSSALKNNPDYVECFELLTQAENTVYTSSAMTDGVKTYVVAKKVSGDNKYLAFISGDQPLEKITTGVTNGKKILVIKESFGNAFVPFLCNNYQEVYVVDPRKIDMNLPEFVKNNGIDEVLAVNYCFGMSNKFYCDSLEALIK